MQHLTDTSSPLYRRRGRIALLSAGMAAGLSVSVATISDARADAAPAMTAAGTTVATDDHQPVRPAWLAALGSDGRPLAPAASADAAPASNSLAERVGDVWHRRLHTLGSKVRQVASWTQHGVATWYGSWHKGRRTSSGAVFDPALMTAAHPSLPLGTKLLVTNTATGDSVVVTVNDREPKHPNSIIDLSRGAAAKLGFVSSGRAAVRLARIAPGQDPVEVADAPDAISGTQPAPEGAAMGLPEAK